MHYNTFGPISKKYEYDIWMDLKDAFHFGTIALKKQRIWYMNGFRRCIITFRYFCIEKTTNMLWYMNELKDAL